MRNILNDQPDTDLTGRLRFSIELVGDKNIRGKEVLDIGCGYGWFELKALDMGVKRVTGMEISSNDLKTAKKHIVNWRSNFKVGSAIKLPFKSNNFDTVVAWEVLEHIPGNTEEIMFKEVARVLKKNGVLCLSTPHNSFFSTIFDPAFWLIGHRHYTKSTLVALGNNHGLLPTKIHLKGGWWSLVGLLNLYVSKWIFQRKPFFEDFFRLKEDKEYGSTNGFGGIFVKYRKS